MTMTIWILTRAINEYNQDGDYFVKAFYSKPDADALAACGVPANAIERVLIGGGRQGTEYEWFMLAEQ